MTATTLPALDPDQIQRYSRHILVPDVGGVGQRRLLAATVEVEVGAGDPTRDAAALVAIAYLAGAGVGALALAGAPDDAVSPAEAADGIAVGAGDIGRPRREAISARVAALTPDVQVSQVSAADTRAVHLAWVDVAALWSALGVREPDTGCAALVAGGAAAVRAVAAIARAEPEGIE